MARPVFLFLTIDIDDEVADEFEAGEDRARRSISANLADLIGEGLGPVGPLVGVHLDTPRMALEVLEQWYMKQLKEMVERIPRDFLDQGGGDLDAYVREAARASWMTTHERQAHMVLAGGSVPDLYTVAERTLASDLDDRVDLIAEAVEDLIGEEEGLSLEDFVAANREAIDEVIHSAAPNLEIDDDDREEWVMNDEGLYTWAQSEGVDI